MIRSASPRLLCSKLCLHTKITDIHASHHKRLPSVDIQSCGVCLKTDNLASFCQRCRSVAYCSLSCRSEDKFFHEMLCEGYTNFLSTRISPNHRAAFHFPLDEDKPRLIWLLSTPIYTIEHIHEREPEPTGSLIYDVSYTNKVHIDDRPLPSWCCDMPATAKLAGFVTMGTRGHQKNRCLNYLLSGTTREDFTGDAMVVRTWNTADEGTYPEAIRPMVAFGGLNLPCKKAEIIEDVSPRDLRHVVNFLKNHAERQPSIPNGGSSDERGSVRKWLLRAPP